MDEADRVLKEFDDWNTKDDAKELARLQRENDRLRVDNWRLRNALMHILGFRVGQSTTDKTYGDRG